jgi:hypothetical protein
MEGRSSAFKKNVTARAQKEFAALKELCEREDPE